MRQGVLHIGNGTRILVFFHLVCGERYCQLLIQLIHGAIEQLNYFINHRWVAMNAKIQDARAQQTIRIKMHANILRTSSVGQYTLHKCWHTETETETERCSWANY